MEVVQDPAAVEPPSEPNKTNVFINGAFEAAAPAEGGGEGVAAQLQAARLRLESAEDEKAALAAELACTQARLHDALEVLEGVLSERSALRRQAQELQAQLEAALHDQRSTHQDGTPGAPLQPAAPVSPTASGIPPQQLRRELLLAQAQLGELRAVQQAWEAERQQLLQEVEEERQRLQEGLAEALTQATSAQREADAAAERATHWCSLAQVLQRSALLSESGTGSPLSPASTTSHYSPAGSLSRYSPAGSLAASWLAASASRSGGNKGSSRRSRLLDDYRSSPVANSQARLWPRLPESPSNGNDAAQAGAGTAAVGGGQLMPAFQAVAAVPESTEKQLQGSPTLHRYSSPVQLSQAKGCKSLSPLSPGGSTTNDACSNSAEGGCSDSAGLAASAELAPGTSLQLLNRLPTPGVSCASSPNMGGSSSRPSPLTPQPFVGASGAVALDAAEHSTPTGHGTSSSPEPVQAAGGMLLPSAVAALAKSRSGVNGGDKARKQGLLGRLLMRSVCAGGLPSEHPGEVARGRRWEQA